MESPLSHDRHTLHRKEADFFDTLYGEHNHHPVGWRLRLQRDLASLLRHAGTPRLGRVLSLGCGDGQFEILLAPHADEVIGIDLSPQAIERATQTALQAGLHHVHFHCMPFEEFPWEET